MTSTAIVWFRRDLRIHDLPSLHAAGTAFERVVPVFVLDPALLGGRFASRSRTAFMLGCLRELDASLTKLGSGLVVRRGRPEAELTRLASEIGADAVFWTSDVSPYARSRDGRVMEALRGAGVAARPQGGSYAADPSKVLTVAGTPFSVFAPFHRAWQQASRREVFPAPRTLAALPQGLERGTLPDAGDLTTAGPDVPEPVVAPGERPARRALSAWLADPVGHYADRHDGMARKGTSVLSPYLRWGCLSPRETEERAEGHGGKGAASWRRQLAWREFYAHVLLHNPDNLCQEYQERYRALEWESDDALLEAWREGRTGYPLVDAGMRQLARTGWMHNRTRLVVGSFLTKDLHLDWRHGELHFERLLLDGEPAQNNGNWQWVASVGVDPAPYFRRMFNPVLQARKFDPDGMYVKRWVPELAGVPSERIFEPWEMPEAEQEAYGCVIGRDYPAPVVDHHAERLHAIERYRAVAAD